MPAAAPTSLADLRAEIAALERGGRGAVETIGFGDERLDRCLPGGGLSLRAWHEFAGEGLDLETGAASAGFVARLAVPLALRGELVWVMRRDDLFAPGLAGLGLPAERLIQVCARDDDDVLAVVEDALRTRGVAAVVAEVESVDLTAGRRLQLAAEQAAATGLVLRRRPFGGADRRDTSSAATTRWSIAPAPSAPADDLGLGAQRWRVSLERSRGGRTGAWLLEAQLTPQLSSGEDEDAAHPFPSGRQPGRSRHGAANTFPPRGLRLP